jgi:FdhD protein
MISKIRIHHFQHNTIAEKTDSIVLEEPLELILAFGESRKRQRKSLSITMRSPSVHDFELALGFLFSEGIISDFSQVILIRYAANVNFDIDLQSNVVLIELHPKVSFSIEKLQRHFYTSSSCGVCGKASIDLVQQTFLPTVLANQPIVSPTVLQQLPQKLRDAQAVFEATGGIHAAALFDTNATLICLREDVGRHNALDKIVGWALKNQKIPLRENILLLSGRISFELVQKAVLAGIPVIAAIGAPSSLAIELAQENNVTLIGFLREQRMNIYCGIERISI